MQNIENLEPLPDEAIVVKGARAHNLKNVNVVIPRDRLTVITGPSGSGKSSLAFDTIYAEGQRRYVESLSTYARQFLVQLERPEVEAISGLSPTISIEQKTTSFNPRSTVGTVTEIYDFLRLLYSRIGKPYCYKCGNPIQSQSAQQMVSLILSQTQGSRLAILAPVVRERKGEYQKELAQLRQNGFARVKIDGEIFDLAEEIFLDKNKKHTIEVYVDRFILKGDLSSIGARVFEAVELALKLGEGLLILEIQDGASKTQTLMSVRFACLTCQISYPTPEPRTFSFNSPMGACPACDGLGKTPEIEGQPSLICSTCKGLRLKKESLHFKIAGKNISDLCALSISELAQYFQSLILTEREKLITNRILKEVTDRLFFLNEIGVSYLSLNRSAQSLSGGETQRIRLATQIGSSLVGVIYVLDEPSIGLHQRDNEKLISMLLRLRDLGNTVLVVEHDRDTIEKADWILDFGPGAGAQGGELVAEGSLKDLLKAKKGLTSQYLRGDLKIQTPTKRRILDPQRVIQIKNANMNNLKNITVNIPLGVFNCVTGVSGSGKSTLIIDTLYKFISQILYGGSNEKIPVESIQGINFIDKIIDIDQSPIGKTPRSNPATYTGLFSLIRQLFAQVPESQTRGYGPGRYSFNVKGGRCEKCMGDGLMKVEMHFLPDLYVQCEVCRGKRYHEETLEILYKGKNISEVLDMTASDALSFFSAIPPIKNKLQVLQEVGLGYLHLGQSATTLSGGEAQRIKLAKELSRRSTGKTLYILDEPSTGLHFDDVNKLLKLLQTLVDQGNTVIVIEHNLDVLKVADHIIDLGPDGGTHGGYVMAEGTPEEIVKYKDNATGKFLMNYLF